MITVDAVDEVDKRASYYQGVPRELDTSAVGCTLFIYNIGNKDVKKEGKLMAAPLVSGMIAVFLSQAEYWERLQVPGKVAANVKKLVCKLSYNSLGGGDTLVAWNGLDVLLCETSSRSLRARGEACAINVTTSTATALTFMALPATFPTTSLVSTSALAQPSVSTSLPVTPKVDPVPCYNFDVNAYGYCCPDQGGPCTNDLGKCYLQFTGKGVGGGGSGIVPTGATCPPPEGCPVS